MTLVMLMMVDYDENEVVDQPLNVSQNAEGEGGVSNRVRVLASPFSR